MIDSLILIEDNKLTFNLKNKTSFKLHDLTNGINICDVSKASVDSVLLSLFADCRDNLSKLRLK
jgi:hypothetical protein